LPAICPANTERHNSQQSILVELKPLIAGLDITHQSAYGSFGFASTTTAARSKSNGGAVAVVEAYPLLDIRGLPGVSGQPTKLREVQMLVRTWNMPRRGETIHAKQSDGHSRGQPQGKILSDAARSVLGEDARVGEVGIEAAGRIQSQFMTGKLTVDDVRAAMPTYLVYVWYNTDRMIRTIDGPRPLWEPLPSFGLFVASEGAARGWQHSLLIDGKVLTSIEGRPIRLRLPKRGYMRLKTVIEVEKVDIQPDAIDG
jgi:hypothetical protein